MMEQVARWAALGLALVAVVGFAVTAGLTVAPLVGWGAALVLTGGLAVALWRRELEARSNRREVDRALAKREDYRGPGQVPPAGPGPTYGATDQGGYGEGYHVDV